MKGKLLTLDEVMNLEGGTKIWVDYNLPQTWLSYGKCHCLCTKKNNRFYDVNYIDEYFTIDSYNKLNFELYEWIKEESIEDKYKEIEKYLGG